MKTGLVLEGGAMRGMYTAGVLDVLLVWALCRSRVFTAAGVWPSEATPAEKGASEQ